MAFLYAYVHYFDVSCTSIVQNVVKLNVSNNGTLIRLRDDAIVKIPEFLVVISSVRCLC